jgi:hypothetical protein
MAGLVPAIHALFIRKDVDARQPISGLPEIGD